MKVILFMRNASSLDHKIRKYFLLRMIVRKFVSSPAIYIDSLRIPQRTPRLPGGWTLDSSSASELSPLLEDISFVYRWKASPRDFSHGVLLHPSYFRLFEDSFDWRTLPPQASSTVRVCTFRRSHCTAHLLRKKPRIPSKDTSLYGVRSLISWCWKTSHKTMSMP